MIRTMLLTADGQYSVGSSEQVESWRAAPSSFIWLDIESPPTDDVRLLMESMQCDPLAISDGFRDRHPPKIEAFTNSTFIVFRGISKIDATLEVSHQQIAMWVGQNYLITYHREASMSVSHMWNSEQVNHFLDSPGTLILKLLHYASGRYLETMLDFEDRLAELEDGLLSDHSEEDMKKLVEYRSRLRKLRRTFNYHKEIGEQLLNIPEQVLPLVEAKQEHLRRDFYDRCERLHSLCQMYYELCGDLVEGHISMSSHQLNQTMKVLTIISALFVPLTFIAGIYGMNFEYMPELAWKYGYFFVIAFMALLAVGLLALFRKAKWL
jgi:magnesium transporter